jgi:stringent starvation protein B
MGWRCDDTVGLSAFGCRLIEHCNAERIIVDLAHCNANAFATAVAHSRAPVIVSHTAAFARPPSRRNTTDEQLRLVANSGGCVGVIFARQYLGESSLNLAQAQEIRDALVELRKVGKKTFVYADSYDTTGYMLASGATNVCIMPGGEIMIPGVGIETMFYKGILDKAGVKADYVQIGEYKGAEEPYTRNEPSPELRGEMNRVVESLYAAGRCPRLHVNATCEGVVCPDHIREQWRERLIIDLDASYPLDLTFAEEGIGADLSFGGHVTRCTFPWKAIYVVADRASGKGIVLDQNMPESVRRSRTPPTTGPITGIARDTPAMMPSSSAPLIPINNIAAVTTTHAIAQSSNWPMTYRRKILSIPVA